MPEPIHILICGVIYSFILQFHLCFLLVTRRSHGARHGASLEYIRKLFFILIRAFTTQRYRDKYRLSWIISPDTCPSHVVSQNQRHPLDR
ncbi:hypothetical protein VZT92_015080 [Zoarces viviparus]|uniref:Secreted protein n=1 Tax=Zoarces viviparus TaxID=48416 RepID=A0AAW1EUX5_ZOAVI